MAKAERHEANIVPQWGDPTRKEPSAGALPNVDLEIDDLLNAKSTLG